MTATAKTNMSRDRVRTLEHKALKSLRDQSEKINEYLNTMEKECGVLMDVTNEILKNHIIYGRDYTAPHRHASGRSLNYAAGPSITRPDSSA